MPFLFNQNNKQGGGRRKGRLILESTMSSARRSTGQHSTAGNKQHYRSVEGERKKKQTNTNEREDE